MKASFLGFLKISEMVFWQQNDWICFVHLLSVAKPLLCPFGLPCLEPFPPSLFQCDEDEETIFQKRKCHKQFAQFHTTRYSAQALGQFFLYFFFYNVTGLNEAWVRPKISWKEHSFCGRSWLFTACILRPWLRFCPYSPSLFCLNLDRTRIQPPPDSSLEEKQNERPSHLDITPNWHIYWSFGHPPIGAF